MPGKPLGGWSEVPVTDTDRAIAVYNAVFGRRMTVDTAGHNPRATFGGDTASIGGHLQPGKPARDSGSTIHIAVAVKPEDAIARVWNAGGEVKSEPIGSHPAA